MSSSNDLLVADSDTQRGSVAATAPIPTAPRGPRKGQQSFGRRRTRSTRSSLLHDEDPTPASGLPGSSGLTPVTTPTKHAADNTASGERAARDGSALPRQGPIAPALPPTPEGSLADSPGSSSKRGSRNDNEVVDITGTSDDEAPAEVPSHTSKTAPEAKRPRRNYTALEGPSKRPKISQETTALVVPESSSSIPNTPTRSSLGSGGHRPARPRVVSAPVAGTSAARSNIIRPSSAHRSRTDPTPSGIKDRERSIDAKIDSYLREPTPDPDPSKELGFVYIVPVLHAGQRILKIGSTSQKDPRKRIEEIRVKCRALDFEIPGEDGDEPWPKPEFSPYQPHYKRAEKLAQLQLGNFLYKFECTCSSKHREFFDVDMDIARRTVDCWILFCAKNPWYQNLDKSLKSPKKSPSPSLKPHWDDRLTKRKQYHITTQLDDHEERHKRWEEFVNMRSADVVQFSIKAVWTTFMPFPWQTLSLLESLVIIGLAPAGYRLWAFVWLCIIMVFALSEVRIHQLAVVLRDVAVLAPSGRRSTQSSVDSSNLDPRTAEDAAPAGTWPEGSQDDETEGPSPSTVPLDGGGEAGSSHDQSQGGDSDESSDERPGDAGSPGA